MAGSVVDIYVSCAEQDAGHLVLLRKALHPHVRDARIRVWDRSEVGYGEKVEALCKEKLGQAQVVILMLSMDYIANETLYAEGREALKRSELSGTRVLSVRLRAVQQSQDPILSLPFLGPSQECPMADRAKPEAAWIAVAEKILAAAGIDARAPADTQHPALPAVPEGPLDLVGDALFEATLLHPAALSCNRRAQWGTLDLLVSDRTRDDLILLPGEQGTGHTYFLQRTGKMLRKDPSRIVVAVEWDTISLPGCEREYREQLALVLNCPLGVLHNYLGQLLSHHNLVLLHHPMDDRFPREDEEINLSLRLFREWLPNLIAAARSGTQQGKTEGHAVKCIQPIRWRPVFALKRWLARAFSLLRGQPLRFMERWDHKHLAKSFMRTLEKSCPEFTVHSLAELTGISNKDVRDVCRLTAIPSTQWDQILDDARAAGPTPEKVLLHLSMLLRDSTRRTA